MSHRPTNAKKIARIRKLLRQTPPQFFDLVQYLMDRRYADTKGAARQLILGGRVKYESHTVGLEEFETLHGPEKRISPYLRLELKDGLRVDS